MREAERPGIAACCLWLGVVGVLSGCNLGQREMEDTTPHGCAECHVDITHQWQQSAHSIAWINPEFVELTREHMAQDCLPCHAPQPLLEQPPGAEAALRASDLHFGVDCNACHQVGCSYVGPYRNLIQAHPTEQDTTRLPCADFCGTCHRMEHEQYVEQYLPSAGDSAGSCSGCHMPAYRSRLTQDHVLSYIHPKRIVRDHTFPVWSECVTAGAIEVASQDARWLSPEVLEIRVTLINRGAGHSIPVGKFGYRELRILAEVLAADGSVIAQEEHAVLPQSEDCLRPQEPTEYELAVRIDEAAPAARIHLVAERVNEDRSFRYPLLDAKWPVTLRPDDR